MHQVILKGRDTAILFFYDKNICVRANINIILEFLYTFNEQQIVSLLKVAQLLARYKGIKRFNYIF